MSLDADLPEAAGRKPNLNPESHHGRVGVAAPERPPAAALLDKKMKKSHAMISTGVVLAAAVMGLGFIGVSIAQDFSNVAVGSTGLICCSSLPC